jgi:hypothetical protein
MVGEPDATLHLTLQDDQLMSKHRVLSLKPQLRLEWRGQDGQGETQQPDHSASLGESITPSTRIRFSGHTIETSNYRAIGRLVVVPSWPSASGRRRTVSIAGIGRLRGAHHLGTLGELKRLDGALADIARKLVG